MKVLIIKNRVTVDVVDDIQKTFTYLQEKTPLKFELTYLNTDLDLQFKPFVGTYFGTTGTKEKLTPLITEAYDIILFLYGAQTVFAQGGTLAGYTFWEGIGKSEYTEVPCYPSNDSNGEIWRTISHELIHALCQAVRRKGLTVRDEMDMTSTGIAYYKNNDPYALDGNYARTLNNLSPYWSSFTSMPAYKYFKASEIVGLKPKLVEMLDRARGFAGVPFIITSGYRTAEHNAEVGGVDGSSHTEGLAVDLLVKDAVSGGKILLGLVQAGFKRFGFYADGHLHADCDDSKVSPAYWIKII